MLDKVQQVVSNVLGVPPSSVLPESSPDSLPEWDSIRHMQLIMALEEEFKVQFKDTEILELLSVDRIVKALDQRQ